MATDLLNKLRDIHYPPPVADWPLAMGWYLLMFILILLLGLAVFLFIKQSRKLRLKKIILKKLFALQANRENYNVAEELSMLLKRVVLARYPREEVAGLHGEAWLAFLDKTASTNQFSEGCGRLLLVCPYQANTMPLPDSLFHLVQDWVKKNL